MRNEQYVFISYAHRDSAAVLPCVEAMKRAGINVWYDEGIQAGSEWPEYIAEKVISCTKFVLFISPAYLDSQNCKRELNFAISRKKDLLSVFIEDVNLSPGVEMQLGTYQAIFRNRYSSDAAFASSLSQESWFNDCRIGTSYSTTQRSTSASGTAQSAGTAQNTGTAPKIDFSEFFSQPKQNTQGKVNTPAKNQTPKSRWVAILLAFFLGGLGVHKFYLKQTLWGILYLVFIWTYIPAFLSFIEALIFLFMSDEKFNAKYNA